jgi:hypothetical protein
MRACELFAKVTMPFFEVKGTTLEKRITLRERTFLKPRRRKQMDGWLVTLCEI